MTRWKKTITSIGALLLVVALLTSCTGLVPSVAPPPALSEKKEVTSEDLLLVDQLLLAGKYEDAVLQLQKLGQIDPKNSAVQDKLATATAEWKFTEAQTLVAVGAYAEAIKKMKTALDVLPNDKRILTAMDEAYLNLGKKYLELLDVARAKEALLAVNYDQNLRLQAQGLMNLDVQAVDNTQKGYQALQAGDYAMAMSYFKAALQLKPDLAQAQSGMKATEMMIAVRPTSIPQTFVQPTYQQPYIPLSGTEQPATTQPTESNSWEKPDSIGAGTNDWGQFKQWMENEINGNQMSGNAINENPLLDFENLAKIEDPQAYNYLAESDFANSLYLTAIKIYGERALYIASEIPRMFPLPNNLDLNYQTARKRIDRLSKATRFVEDGISGLKPPTIFKATQKNLQALIDNELAILTSSSIAGFFAPPEAGQLSDQSQAYVDEFDLAQSKVLMVPFSQLPPWAQVKRYYIEASLNAYMLNEVASDFEQMLPLPKVLEGRPVYSPASTLGGVSTQLYSSNATPKAGEEVTFKLLAYNSSTITVGANIHASLPPYTTLVDQGAGVYTIENGQPVIVWENIQLPPVTNTNTAVTAPSAVTTLERSFVLRIEPEALNQNLTFKVWLVKTTIGLPAFTDYTFAGPLSAQIGIDNADPLPGQIVKYYIEVINGSKDPVSFDLSVPIPSGCQLWDVGTPVGSQIFIGSQRALQWTNQQISGGAKLVYSFEVKIPEAIVIGTNLSTYANIILRSAGAYLPQSASTSYSAAGPISAKISVDLANPHPGDNMVYTVDVVNGSNGNASFDLTVPLPSYTSLVDMGTPVGVKTTYGTLSAIQWPGQTMGPQETKSFRFTVNLSSGAPFVNLSTFAHVAITLIGGISPGGMPVTLPWAYFGDLLRGQVGVDRNTVASGDLVTYTCTAENTTSITPERVTIVFPIPNNAVVSSYTGAPALWTINGSDALVWPYGPPGPMGLRLDGKYSPMNPDTWAVGTTFKATGVSGSIDAAPYLYLHGAPTSTSTISSIVLDVPGEPPTSAPVYYGPLDMTIGASISSPLPGQEITYTVTVNNSSNIDETFSLSVPLPTYSVLTDPGEALFGQFSGGQTLLWPVKTIDAGGTMTLTFKVIVQPTAASGLSVSTSATFDLGTVLPLGMLSVSISSGPAPSTNTLDTAMIIATVTNADVVGSSFNTPTLTLKVISPDATNVQSVSSELSLPVGTGAAPGYRGVLDEVIRLVRYSENLQYNISTTRTPSNLDVVSTNNLVRAAKELASSLYWIPVSWAQLAQAPVNYFVGYPSAYGLDIVDKNAESFLSLSADLTKQVGTPESWKDMIEFLRAQLLQRLAELGYR